MEHIKWRTFRIDGDALRICFHLDANSGIYFGEYPAFDENPRYTPGGRPWRSVVAIGCPYADSLYDDCGSCPHLKKEAPHDMIGVCFHEQYHTAEKSGE